MISEKSGNIFDVKRMAVHDGRGIRTTVFLKGCPLHCVWCHNPEGISASTQIGYFSNKCAACGRCAALCSTGAQSIVDGRHLYHRELCVQCGACVQACYPGALAIYGKPMTVSSLMPLLLEDVDFYECTGGGVTLSGGEPLLQPDFCEVLLCALQAKGIHTAVDTCGCVPWEAFVRVAAYTDQFLYDIKHIDGKEHALYTGCDNAIIIDNLRRLNALGASIEVRIPLVPGCNDAEITLRGIGALLGELRCVERAKVLPYHGYATAKYDGNQQRTPQFGA